MDFDVNDCKICSSCKEIKTLDLFHKLKTGKFGFHSHCKKCRSNYSKKNKYQRPKYGIVMCQKCNKFKPLDKFYRNSSSSNGIQSYCIICHKEKIYESQSKLSGYISKIIKKMNKKSITKEIILGIYEKQNKKCALTSELLTYYSGSPLTANKYESKFNICIDKIDERKPFEPNNIQLIGDSISKMKKNLTNLDFIHLCKLVSSKN